MVTLAALLSVAFALVMGAYVLLGQRQGGIDREIDALAAEPQQRKSR